MSEIVWTSSMTPIGRCSVAIGVFDGVHIGHQALLRFTVAQARSLDAVSVAVTFDRDPDQVVSPEAAAPQLLDLSDKCRFIKECGIDTILVMPFTESLARTAPSDFLDQVLGGLGDIVAVNVGYDFRFGAGAAGDVSTLGAWGESHGATVTAHTLVEFGDEPVTATRIRRLVVGGEVERAAALIGRPTRVSGTVRHGAARGRRLGFPTANIAPAPHSAIPGDGVYGGFVEFSDGSVHRAAISVGMPPMYPDSKDYLEAHLIDFDDDVYGQDVAVSFVSRLRDLRSFSSEHDLIAAITADVDAVRTLALD